MSIYLQVAAVKGNNQCFCSSSLNMTSGGYQVLNSECNVACAGDASLTCGASTRLAVYNVAKSGISPAKQDYEGIRGETSIASLSLHVPC
jgi:hypothetical protein